MLVPYAVFDIKFSVTDRFLMKVFHSNFYLTMNYMSVLDKEAKN